MHFGISQYASPAWHLRTNPTWPLVSTGRTARTRRFTGSLPLPLAWPPLLAASSHAWSQVANSCSIRQPNCQLFPPTFPHPCHLCPVPQASEPTSVVTFKEPPNSRASAQLTVISKEQFADSCNATRRAETTRRDRVFAHPVMF